MRELVIDFSSSSFVIAEIRAGREPEVIATINDEVVVALPRAAAAGGSATERAEEHAIPALRENFPILRSPELRELCWQAIFERLAAHLEKHQNTTADLKVHAIFPQTWRATEAQEFRTELESRRLSIGLVASETACVAMLIATELPRFSEVNAPDPLNVKAVIQDFDQKRCWSFEWFRTCKPPLLCLNDYAPGWTRNYTPANSQPDILIVVGKREAAERGSASIKITNTCTVEEASDFPLLHGLAILLGPGYQHPVSDLRIELAPSLAWRWGHKSQIVALPACALLDASGFPLRVEKECSYLARRDSWDNVAFWLEAAWGGAPESWAPLASVQLPASVLHRWKRNGAERSLKLTLQMPAPSHGKITLETIESSGPAFCDCSEFKLGSALA